MIEIQVHAGAIHDFHESLIENFEREIVPETRRRMNAALDEAMRRIEHHITSPAGDRNKAEHPSCQHCKTRLHSEASIARGVCAGCFADSKQIGPDRPTG